MTCTELERLLDQPETDAQTLRDMQSHAAQCTHCRMLMELRNLDRDEDVPEKAAARWRARWAGAKEKGTLAHSSITLLKTGTPSPRKIAFSPREFKFPTISLIPVAS